MRKKFNMSKLIYKFVILSVYEKEITMRADSINN